MSNGWQLIKRLHFLYIHCISPDFFSPDYQTKKKHSDWLSLKLQCTKVNYITDNTNHLSFLTIAFPLSQDCLVSLNSISWSVFSCNRAARSTRSSRTSWACRSGGKPWFPRHRSRFSRTCWTSWHNRNDGTCWTIWTTWTRRSNWSARCVYCVRVKKVSSSRIRPGKIVNYYRSTYELHNRFKGELHSKYKCSSYERSYWL